MEKNYTILVADRNPRVRDLIKRELIAEGYSVQLAKNGVEVLKWAYHHDPIDLVILDPNFTDSDQSILLEKLRNRIPAIPILFHAFLSDYTDNPMILEGAFLIEKGETNIDRLKQIAVEILNKGTNRMSINKIKQNSQSETG